MSWLLAVIIAIHGLIHLMGFAKAFGWAELPQLTLPISRAGGVAWLVAAVLVLASAVMYPLGTRRFWMVGALAVLVSQLVIVSAWRDARAGTIANVLLLAVVTHAWLTEASST